VYIGLMVKAREEASEIMYTGILPVLFFVLNLLLDLSLSLVKPPYLYTPFYFLVL